MYRLYNNLFIGIAGAILLAISIVLTLTSYQSDEIKSNIDFKNHNQAKEIFLVQLTNENNEASLLKSIQTYYSYMPYEFDIYTVQKSGRQKTYYLTTESRNIEKPEYYLSNNLYVKNHSDLFNYLVGYIYLLEGKLTESDEYLKEIHDKRLYNTEFLQYWKDSFSPIKNTKLSAAIYLKQSIHNPNYEQIITNHLYNIYYETKNWDKLEELCSSEQGKYLSIQQFKWAYSATGNFILFEFWNIISLIYSPNTIFYIFAFVCFYFGLYYYISFDTFNPNPVKFYLKIIGYSLLAYLLFYIISERISTYFRLDNFGHYILIHIGYVLLSIFIIFLFYNKHRTKLEGYDYFIIGGVSTLVFSCIYLFQSLELNGLRYLGYLFIFENFSNVAFIGIASYQIIYSLYFKKEKIWEGVIFGILLSSASIILLAIIRYSIPEELGNMYFNLTFVGLAILFHYYLLNSINISPSFTLKNNPDFINFFNGILIIFIILLALLITHCGFIYDETVGTGIMVGMFSTQKALLIVVVFILIYKTTPMKGFIFPFGLYLTKIQPFTYIERELYEKGVYKLRKHISTKDFAKHLLPTTASYVKEYPIKNEHCYHLIKFNQISSESPYSEFAIIKVLYDSNLNKEFVQLYLIAKYNWVADKKLTRNDLTNAGMIRFDLA